MNRKIVFKTDPILFKIFSAYPIEVNFNEYIKSVVVVDEIKIEIE